MFNQLKLTQVSPAFLLIKFPHQGDRNECDKITQIKLIADTFEALIASTSDDKH